MVVAYVPFSNGPELANSDYQITVERGTALAGAFETAKDGELKQFWNTKFVDKEKSLNGGLQKAISLVLSENYAFFEGRAYTYSSQEYATCQILDTNFVLLKNNLAFPVSKSSPYKTAFNFALLKMKENGELIKIRNKYARIPPNCAGSKGRTLGFESVPFPFLVFMLGLLLSLFSLLSEVLFKHPISSGFILKMTEQKFEFTN